MAQFPLAGSVSRSGVGGVHKDRNQSGHEQRFRVSTLTSVSFNKCQLSPTMGFHGESAGTVSPPEYVLPKPSSSHLKGDLYTDNEQHKAPREYPQNNIYPCNRRSLVFKDYMMEERMSYKLIGRDKDGTPTYRLTMEESQGFKWNKNLCRYGKRSFLGHALPKYLEDEADSFSDLDDEIDPYEESIDTATGANIITLI